MIKFTKEEISLCKQVVEKYRKLIGEGDWYLPFADDEDPELYIAGITDDKANAVGVPLWTIPDCLEFLREKGIRFAFYHYEVDKYYVDCGYDNKRQWSDIVAYKTPLEACLKAVLAVLEEIK